MTICDSKAVQNRIYIFTGMEIKTTMRVGFDAIAINDAFFRAGFRADCDGPCLKVDIAVFVPRVDTVGNPDCPALPGVVDSFLYGRTLSRDRNFAGGSGGGEYITQAVVVRHLRVTCSVGGLNYIKV